MVRCSSLVVVFLLCVGSCYATKIVDVDIICKGATNASLCSEILNSKPGGAKGSDLVSLAQYTIDVARANLTNSVKLIKTLIGQSGSDANAKEHYSKCLSHFVSVGGALTLVDDAERLLKQKNYMGMIVAANDIVGEYLLCINDPNMTKPLSL